MNKEIRSVRINGQVVAITLNNEADGCLELLKKKAKSISNSKFQADVQSSGAFKKVKIIFEEPMPAKSMFQFVSHIMYDSVM